MAKDFPGLIHKLGSSVTVKDGLVINVDKAFTDLTGYPENNLLYRSFSDILRLDLKATIMQNSLSEPGESAECFIFTSGLKPREVRIKVCEGPNTGEHVIRFIKILSGLHSGFSYIKALHRHEGIAAAIYAVKPRIVLLAANEAYLEMYGISEVSDALGRSIDSVIPNWCQGRTQVWETLLKGGQTAFQKGYEYRHQRGTKLLRTTLTPMYDKKAIKYIMETTTDITEASENCIVETVGSFSCKEELVETYEKLLNDEKAKKEALAREIETKNEFISFITHEFKTPLAVINSAVQAIEYLCKDELSYKFRDFLGKIKQNSFRQLRLVNNLLDITRLNSGHYKVLRKNMDIVALTRDITESVRLYAQQKNIELEFNSTLVSRVVGIDEEKFERVMLNLLSNAIKFTPEGKKVSVTVSERLTHTGNYVSLEVKDEGVGIPKEKQQIIFELFGQVENSLSRQAEGTGIGLSIVKKMVMILGGAISLESDTGKGSTFEVLLPDLLTEEDPLYKSFGKFTDSRLIQATAIEFSQMYQ